MSGIFLRHFSIGMVILVNHRHVRSRKRFSYAHEYAHALLDRMTTSAIVSRRENAFDLIERRANAFAAAFLMPAEGVRWFLEEVLEKGAPSRRYRVAYSSAGGEAGGGRGAARAGLSGDYLSRRRCPCTLLRRELPSGRLSSE